MTQSYKFIRTGNTMARDVGNRRADHSHSMAYIKNGFESLKTCFRLLLLIFCLSHPPRPRFSSSLCPTPTVAAFSPSSCSFWQTLVIRWPCAWRCLLPPTSTAATNFHTLMHNTRGAGSGMGCRSRTIRDTVVLVATTNERGYFAES